LVGGWMSWQWSHVNIFISDGWPPIAHVLWGLESLSQLQFKSI
jgi:hypothetical protein